MRRRFRGFDDEEEWRRKMDEMQYWRERGYWPPNRNRPSTEQDYHPTFGGENFGGEGGPVDWMHPGGPARFAGRGPSNYERTDERIVEDVNEELTRHPMVDATNIEVTAENGEVTLRGTVENHPMKRMAEDAALSVWGVKDVHNKIKIKSQRQEVNDRGAA